MNAYGTVLKQLIQLTGSKLSTISDVIGYDVSYISKWCNKSMLPAAKMAPEINRSLSGQSREHHLYFIKGELQQLLQSSFHGIEAADHL